MLLIPWTSALVISADEPYEFSKATLLSHGWTLYDPVWSDQPPIHTWLLSWAIQLFDQPVIGARLLAFGFSSLLLFGVGRLIALYHGKWAGLMGMLLLVLAPHMMELMASATLMVPVMSIGVLSVMAFAMHVQTGRIRYMILSGVCMGIALQIKLTAFILIPAIVLQCIWLKRVLPKNRFREVLVYWMVSLIILYTLPFLMFPEMNSEHLLSTHFSDFSGLNFQGMYYDTFDARLLMDQPECVSGLLVGCLLLRRWSSRKHLILPLVWLLSCVLIHSMHQPFWWYYTLHFSIPICWITAAAWERSLRSFWSQNQVLHKEFLCLYEITISQLLPIHIFILFQLLV